MLRQRIESSGDNAIGKPHSVCVFSREDVLETMRKKRPDFITSSDKRIFVALVILIAFCAVLVWWSGRLFGVS